MGYSLEHGIGRKTTKKRKTKANPNHADNVHDGDPAIECACTAGPLLNLSTSFFRSSTVQSLAHRVDYFVHSRWLRKEVKRGKIEGDCLPRAG